MSDIDINYHTRELVFGGSSLIKKELSPNNLDAML